MNVSLARPQQIPALRQLWKDTFEDTDAYLDLFFSQRFWPDHCVVCTERTAVLGMFFILDCSLRTPQGEVRAAYNYALAVDSAARGRGLSRAILSFLDDYQRSQGYAVSLLKPATQQLFEYYQKFGYTQRFPVRRARLLPAQLPPALPCTVRPVEAAEYLRLRRFWLDQVSGCYLDWDLDGLDYCLQHERFFGGKAIALQGAGFTACAVLHYSADGTLLVKEMVCSAREYLPDALAALLAHEGAPACELLAPMYAFPGEDLPYGYAKWYDPAAAAQCAVDTGYMGLLLD